LLKRELPAGRISTECPGDGSTIDHTQVGITAAMNADHAKHFIAGLEARRQHAAFLNDGGKIPPWRLRPPIARNRGIFSGTDLEVDGVHARRGPPKTSSAYGV
jgi:hypothetical protein